MPGWVNVDLDLSGQPDVCADLSVRLPFRDAVAEFMHTEDFLDQLDIEQAHGFLGECHRVLKPGGRLSITDIVSGKQLSQSIVNDPKLWAS